MSLHLILIHLILKFKLLIKESYWAITDTGVQFCFIQEPGIDSLDPGQFMEKAIRLDSGTSDAKLYGSLIQHELAGILENFINTVSGSNTLKVTVPPPPQHV